MAGQVTWTSWGTTFFPVNLTVRPGNLSHVEYPTKLSLSVKRTTLIKAQAKNESEYLKKEKENKQAIK